MKVFNEKETADILKTAARSSKGAGEEQRLGLTIDELEHVAQEAGIDPSEIGRAVEAMELKRQSAHTSFWGGPFTFSETVLIDHEITATEWENMLIPIREFFQSKGEVSIRESVFEWSSPVLTTNSAHITAIKENGTTKVSIRWSGPMTALPYYLPLPFVGILYLVLGEQFLSLTPAMGLSSMALLLGLTFATGRWALGRRMKKGFAKLRSLAAVLQRKPTTENEILTVPKGKQTAFQPDSPEVKPLLDLDLGNALEGGIEAKPAVRSKE